MPGYWLQFRQKPGSHWDDWLTFNGSMQFEVLKCDAATYRAKYKIRMLIDSMRAQRIKMLETGEIFIAAFEYRMVEVKRRKIVRVVHLESHGIWRTRREGR